MNDGHGPCENDATCTNTNGSYSCECANGWTGKNWACHQLSKYANGDFFLFIDADTKLQKNTIAEAVSEMNRNDIDLLSLFPNRITKTVVDKNVPAKTPKNFFFKFIAFYLRMLMKILLSVYNLTVLISLQFLGFHFLIQK